MQAAEVMSVSLWLGNNIAVQMTKEQSQQGTYRAVEHVLSPIAAFLDMALQGTRIEWFE